jgi:hypothetical protein
VIHRTISCVVLGLAAAALLVPTAAADQPIKEPLPFSDLTGQFCEDFQVLVHATDNKEVIHIFSSGVALITGVLKVEVTNLTTGETLALNISGPGKISPDGSTISGSGRWLLFGEAGQLGPGSGPGMILVAGRLTLALGPAGIESMVLQGHIEDVCAALAAA